MNRKMLPLQMNKLRILGSWSQCIRKKRKGALHEPQSAAGILPAARWRCRPNLSSLSSPPEYSFRNFRARFRVLRDAGDNVPRSNQNH